MNSPCVGVCTINPAIGLCAGCGRTLQEISGWSSMPQAERERIMTLLPERLRGPGMTISVEG